MDEFNIWGDGRSSRGKKKKTESMFSLNTKTPSLKIKPLSSSKDIFSYRNEKEEARDSRRIFSPTQRKEILHQQDMKCGRCHKSLDPREIEYDHKKPWSARGRTITENGRALCGSCHKIITHEHRLKQIDKKRKKNSSQDSYSGIFSSPKLPKSNQWGF